MMNIFKYGTVLFVFLGCGLFSGKPEDKNFSDRFNAENYQEGLGAIIAPTGGVTIAERRSKASLLNGKAVYSFNEIEYPVRGETVILKDASRIISKKKTSIDGTFTFEEKVSDGKYMFELESALYNGSVELELQGYRAENIKLVATKK